MPAACAWPWITPTALSCDLQCPRNRGRFKPGCEPLREKVGAHPVASFPALNAGGRQTGRNEPRAPTLKHRTVGLPRAPKTEQRGGFILLGRRAPLAPQLLLEPE